MRVSEYDRKNLTRFGCTLHADENLLLLRWTDLGRDRALAASILVRTIYAQCSSGPLLCLALEVSQSCALAHYCYFPFNERDPAHRAYLTFLTTGGQLHLAFVDGRKIISRDHQLLPTQRKRLSDMHSKAIAALESCKTYPFSDVVAEFERTIRIPHFFERATSDEEIFKTVEGLKAKAYQVPAEKRILAERIVGGIADVVRNRYGDNVRKFISDMLSLPDGLMILFDYQREFGDDLERVVEYLSYHIAVNSEDAFLKEAADWPRKLESILKTLADANTSAEEKQKINSEFKSAIGRALNYLSRGRGLSVSVLQGIVLPFRALLPAQPGRPVEDYEKQYNWKASGMSWTEVAAKHYQENESVRAEFGGRDFGSLDFEEKELLKNRVREGVRSHAERAGKPFPVPEPSSQSTSN
jgi:hypothetical protein